MKQSESDQKPNMGEDIAKMTPYEYIAGQLPKQSFKLMLISLAGVIGMLGLSGISYFILNKTDLVNTLIMVIESIISIVFFIQALIIYQNSIKKDEMIVLREHRGGIFSFDKQKLTKPVLFDKNDPTSIITVLWNGSGMEKNSGAKVLLLKEGNKSNENINLCVPETEWSKNLASMVRAKTFADLAESELLNTKSLFGLKWQDFVLIFLVVFALIIIVIQVGLTPAMVSEAIIKKLSDGTLQGIIQSVLLTKGV